MGAAAYHRGTLLIRAQHDSEVAAIYAAMELKEVRNLVADIERLDAGIADAAESFRYFYAAEWWREARCAMQRGKRYQATRAVLMSRLHRMGFRREPIQ